MVEELLEQPGSAYDPVLFEFTDDVTNDQTAEIERMNALLASLSTDPRATLTAGFRDAGQALMNMELVATLPKPPGFFDPQNPAGLPPEKPKKDSDESAEVDDDGQSIDDTEWGERSPLLSFSNTDSSNPIEIAYFDRGPIHEEHLILGGFWSSYWYKGKIYGTEIARGLDVLALLPSEYLSENEVAAAAIANQGERFNPQQR